MKAVARLRWIAIAVARDRRGVAAVEFALLLPVMLMLYLGGVEISEAVSTYRLVDLTANTVTNLVTQYSTISASQTMPDILNASVQVMYPNPSSAAVVVVSCIAIDKNGKATVSWSQALNGTARPTGQVVTVPSSLDIANTTVVLGETTYAYTAAFDFLKLGSFNLSSSIYMVPRASTTINLTS
ncbi:MAG TPA: TadE/TadG family type IV pilus assembly protein [Stellaceae bacterium]|nr:TadE/TadG family type IV pilus assembly protein [Stellaceae bacterium]